MFKGPFTIEASETAEKMDLDNLADVERDHLVDGLDIDDSRYDIYRFFILPRMQLLDEPPNRKEKKQSFDKVNRVLVDIARRSEGIKLAGMFPSTLNADGNWELDIGASAILNPVAPGVGRLKLGAEGKKLVRQKKRPWIKAQRTDANAQWIFFEEWLHESGEFKFKVTCAVEKSLASEERYIRCNAVFSDKGRAIEKLDNHDVYLPA